MTVHLLTDKHAAIETVTPAAQDSTNDETVVTGSGIDARGWTTICYTAVNGDEANTVQWSVYGANASDYADEVAVQALTDLAPGAAGAYTVSPAPYGYYRVKIHSKVDGSHGAVTVHGIAKG